MRTYLHENKLKPSVTTILSSTKDMTHLIEWRKRVGEENAKRITTEAAGVGTAMHNNLINDRIGNVIQNANTHNMNTTFAFEKLYKKLNFFSSKTALSTLSLDLNLSFNFVPLFTLFNST